jgi:hypothetical protein
MNPIRVAQTVTDLTHSVCHRGEEGSGGEIPPPLNITQMYGFHADFYLKIKMAKTSYGPATQKIVNWWPFIL